VLDCPGQNGNAHQTVGLLAGLWDYPSIPNVSSSSSESLENHARDLVTQAFPTIKDDKTLTIKIVQVLGSVLHVFSHVKKTFQVVLICLESPADVQQPPSATTGDWMDDRQAEVTEDAVPKRATKKRKVELSKEQDDEQDTDDGRLKWVLEVNVAQEK
jgi:adenine-specific DNA glycosylase